MRSYRGNNTHNKNSNCDSADMPRHSFDLGLQDERFDRGLITIDAGAGAAGP